MDEIIERSEERVVQSLEELEMATPLTREEKLNKLLSAVDSMTVKEEGFKNLLQFIPRLEKVGIFQNTVWEDTDKLVPTLVGGTLQAGFPTDVYEILSELRFIHRLHSPETTAEDKEQALTFLKEVLVRNLSLLFPTETEESRELGNHEQQSKLQRLFMLIIDYIPADDIKISLSEEIKILSAQKKIVTDRIENMIRLVAEKISLEEGKEADDFLSYYQKALMHPSEASLRNRDLESYQFFLKKAWKKDLMLEAEAHGECMKNTGLVAPSHVLLLRFLAHKANDLDPDIIMKCLALDAYGKVDWDSHREFILKLILEGISIEFKQSVYGLHCLLERSLLSRDPVKNALTRMMNVSLHPEIEALLRRSRSIQAGEERPLLIAGVICVLGMPLGVGQGNNPTCQSARGISMWSQHSPAKLLQNIMLCAQMNSLDISYEGEYFESSMVLEGLTKTFDFNLDPVSIVLVPHLDKLYNQMMQKAAFKYPGTDPHSSVNPEFYGSFIQNGFTSVYNPTFHAIQNFERFCEIFYLNFHPEFNGGNPLVYPVPLGIFITTSQAKMLGFHAISLLRVGKDPNGQWRCYFLNPNNEGRQNWGQGIRPTVYGNGEQPGESSLIFEQLLSRVYAFHYNELALQNKNEPIPVDKINQVKQLAQDSWGKEYVWI